MEKAEKDEITKVEITPLIPVKVPTAAINLISPPPMASFLKIILPITASPQRPKKPIRPPAKHCINCAFKLPLKAGLIKNTNSPKTVKPIENLSGII